LAALLQNGALPVALNVSSVSGWQSSGVAVAVADSLLVWLWLTAISGVSGW